MSLGANKVAMFAASNTESYIEASGGTETTDGDYKYHTFTGDDTFSVTKIGSVGADYTVVAGGGGGGGPHFGGGGGAGGMISVADYEDFAVGDYAITVGGGGAGATTWLQNGTDGSASSLASLTSTTGGGGGAGYRRSVEPTGW